MIRRQDKVTLKIGDWENPRTIELTAHEFYELECWFRMTEDERHQYLMDEVSTMAKIQMEAMKHHLEEP